MSVQTVPVDGFAAWLRQLASSCFPSIFQPSILFPGFQSLDLVPGFLGLAPRLFEVGEGAKELIFDDDALRPITSTGDQGTFIQASLGFGWHTTWKQIPYGLIGTGAARAALMLNQTLDGFQAAVVEALNTFRRLLQGQQDRGLVVSGLDGIALSDGLWVATPWGRLRSAQDHERRVSLGAGNATAVLIDEAPLRLFVSAAGSTSANEHFDSKYWSQKEESSLLLALGCFLSQSAAGGAPGTVWTTEVIPGQGGWGSSGRGRVRGGDGTLQVGQDGASNVEEWCRRVANLYSKELKLASSRLLSAVRERDTPDDALIDAVIALESLFGLGQESETTFRVSAAAATLLAGTLDERIALRRKIAATYGARSRLVHGGESVSGIEDHRSFAIEIVARCLQALFLQRSDLIPRQDRGVVLLLE
jgi:hypothetical protein